jgi:hypothetical protein
VFCEGVHHRLRFCLDHLNSNRGSLSEYNNNLNLMGHITDFNSFCCPGLGKCTTIYDILGLSVKCHLDCACGRNW